MHSRTTSQAETELDLHSTHVSGKLKMTQEEANIAKAEIEEKKDREKKASQDKKELASAPISLHSPSLFYTHTHTHSRTVIFTQEKELARLREKRNDEISIMDEQIKSVGRGSLGARAHIIPYHITSRHPTPHYTTSLCSTP